jgi:hypothetical protein
VTNPQSRFAERITDLRQRFADIGLDGRAVIVPSGLGVLGSTIEKLLDRDAYVSGFLSFAGGFAFGRGFTTHSCLLRLAKKVNATFSGWLSYYLSGTLISLSVEVVKHINLRRVRQFRAACCEEIYLIGSRLAISFVGGTVRSFGRQE